MNDRLKAAWAWARLSPAAATSAWGALTIAFYAWSLLFPPSDHRYREAAAYAIAVACFWRIHVVNRKLHQLTLVAGSRAVGICGHQPEPVLGGPAPICDLPAGHAGWHGANNPLPISSTGRFFAGLPSRVSWTATRVKERA